MWSNALAFIWGLNQFPPKANLTFTYSTLIGKKMKIKYVFTLSTWTNWNIDKMIGKCKWKVHFNKIFSSTVLVCS